MQDTDDWGIEDLFDLFLFYHHVFLLRRRRVLSMRWFLECEIEIP